ncbi:hypothetical protein [Methylosinus sp. PW1]|uniref:DUF4376 domain-containing protein n=1 Tax=Methylosinus sp. PW1 TaxID=107636 RepID=UPI00055C0968|nr:hypothetical protein [Methylosinus sp. PW1]
MDTIAANSLPTAQAYVLLGDDKRARAFFLQGLNSNIPAGAVAITRAVYDALRANFTTLTYDAATGTTAPYVAPAPTKDALIAYTDSKRDRVAASGITVNIAAAGQPSQNIKVATQAQNNSDYQGLYLLAAQNSAFTTEWDDAVLGGLTINATQVAIIANAAAAFRQAAFAAGIAVKAQIAAGTITTTAQIDAFAWPSNA